MSKSPRQRKQEQRARERKKKQQIEAHNQTLRIRELTRKRVAAYRSRRNLPEALEDACAGHPAAAKLKCLPVFDRSYPPTPEIQTAWSSDSKVPQLFPIEACLIGKPPRAADLFRHISLQPDISDVLAQPFQKEELPLEQSLYFANIPIQSPPWQIKLPSLLEGCFTVSDPSTLSHQSLNLSNRKAIFDFHIDEGTSGISSCTSDKIWIFAPLSLHNIAVFIEQESKEHSQILPESIHKMENLIIIKTSPEDALWLPTGVLHCTYATAPGAVYGNVFEIIEDVHIMAKCLPPLFPISTATRRKHCVQRFNQVLSQALEKESTVHSAIACLCNPAFCMLMQQNRKTFALTITFFRKHFRQSKPRWNPQDLCPCDGHRDLATTIRHIKTEHIDGLGYARTSKITELKRKAAEAFTVANRDGGGDGDSDGDNESVVEALEGVSKPIVRSKRRPKKNARYT